VPGEFVGSGFEPIVIAPVVTIVEQKKDCTTCEHEHLPINSDTCGDCYHGSAFVAKTIEPKIMETEMSETKDCLTCVHKNNFSTHVICSTCFAFDKHERVLALTSGSLNSKLVKRRLQFKWKATVALCEKHGIKPMARHDEEEAHVFAFDDYEENYQFPFGVVEGKLVYDGDKLYGGHDGKSLIVVRKGVNLTKADGGIVDLSWNPRPDTKHVMIGGMTYQAPQATNEGIIGGGVLNTKIQFASPSDAAKAGEIIQKLFGVKL
jgi:hypothetical protein